MHKIVASRRLFEVSTTTDWRKFFNGLHKIVTTPKAGKSPLELRRQTRITLTNSLITSEKRCCLTPFNGHATAQAHLTIAGLNVDIRFIEKLAGIRDELNSDGLIINILDKSGVETQKLFIPQEYAIDVLNFIRSTFLHGTAASTPVISDTANRALTSAEKENLSASKDFHQLEVRLMTGNISHGAAYSQIGAPFATQYTLEKLRPLLQDCFKQKLPIILFVRNSGSQESFPGLIWAINDTEKRNGFTIKVRNFYNSEHTSTLPPQGLRTPFQFLMDSDDQMLSFTPDPKLHSLYVVQTNTKNGIKTKVSVIEIESGECLLSIHGLNKALNTPDNDGWGAIMAQRFSEV